MWQFGVARGPGWVSAPPVAAAAAGAHNSVTLAGGGHAVIMVHKADIACLQYWLWGHGAVRSRKPHPRGALAHARPAMERLIVGSHTSASAAAAAAGVGLQLVSVCQLYRYPAAAAAAPCGGWHQEGLGSLLPKLSLAGCCSNDGRTAVQVQQQWGQRQDVLRGQSFWRGFHQLPWLLICRWWRWMDPPRPHIPPPPIMLQKYLCPSFADSIIPFVAFAFLSCSPVCRSPCPS